MRVAPPRHTSHINNTQHTTHSPSPPTTNTHNAQSKQATPPPPPPPPPKNGHPLPPPPPRTSTPPPPPGLYAAEGAVLLEPPLPLPPRAPSRAGSDTRRSKVSSSADDEPLATPAPLDAPAAAVAIPRKRVSFIPSFRRRREASCSSLSSEPTSLEPKVAVAGSSDSNARARAAWWGDRLVIRPQSRPKVLFDAFVVVCVLYSIISMPLLLAFMPLSLVNDTGLVVLSALMDVVFAFDIVLQFFHGYVEDGFPVLSLRTVAWTYATSWFPLDFVAALPIAHPVWRATYVVHADLGASAVAWIPAILKLARIGRLARVMSHWHSLSGGNLLRVFGVICSWMLVSHWFACLWFFIGWSECVHLPPAAGGSITGESTWLTAYWPALLSECAPGSANKPEDVAHLVAPGTLYIRSLYWALSTMSSMGYGAGPVAVTDAEFAYSIFCQVVGACIAAIIFSNVAQFVNRYDAASLRHQEREARVSEFIRFHHLQPALQRKLRAYTELQFSVNRGFNMADIAKDFPLNLQEDIFYQLHEKLVRNVPMFAALEDDGFIRSVAKMLKPQVLLEGDYLFKAHDIGDTMYFISKGNVQITNAGGLIVFVTLSSGAYFGELSMFTATPRIAGARAQDNCILYSLSMGDFDEVLHLYPQHYDRILNHTMERLEDLLRSNTASLEARMIQTRLRNALDRVLSERQMRASVEESGKTQSRRSSATGLSIFTHGRSNSRDAVAGGEPTNSPSSTVGSRRRPSRGGGARREETTPGLGPRRSVVGRRDAHPTSAGSHNKWAQLRNIVDPSRGRQTLADVVHAASKRASELEGEAAETSPQRESSLKREIEDQQHELQRVIDAKEALLTSARRPSNAHLGDENSAQLSKLEARVTHIDSVLGELTTMLGQFVASPRQGSSGDALFEPDSISRKMSAAASPNPNKHE